MRSRLVCLLLALVAWAGVLAARLHHVQIVEHEKYVARAQEQHLEPVQLTPPRGTIFDREGRELAMSVSVDSAFAPRGMENPQAAAKAISAVVGGDPSRLADKLAQRKWTWIARQIEPGMAARLKSLELEGVHFVQESKRSYPLRGLASSVLGFVGLDHTGLAGLEAAYDEDISGDPAAGVVLRDARAGRAVAPGLSFVDAKPGKDLYLTIDAGIQYIVERELSRALKVHSAKAATAVFMDPTSGAIYAMASLPSFDPNRFRHSPKEHWRNRVVQDAYEPGSTLKLMTAAAVLEANLLDPVDLLDCEMGAITLGRTRIRDHKPFGVLTFGEVLAHSSNVGAIKAGLIAGPEQLSRQFEVFGLGSTTGIDLPGENRGIVRPVERWSRHEVAYASIGQGLSATPLQLARAYAVIANGGQLVTPHVVGAVGSRPRRPLLSEERSALSAATIRTLLRFLEAVVEEGTGTAAAVPGYRVAGKTGTAQKAGISGYAPDLYVASFAGFAPSRGPRIVGVVTIDEPRGGQYHGGDVAAPVFSAILNQVLPLLGVAPEGAVVPPAAAEAIVARDQPDRSDDAPGSPGKRTRWQSGAVPDFAGLSARQALTLATGAGLHVEFEGSGFVRNQVPAPGAAIEGAGSILLRLEPGQIG